jgi:hypothetical protein
MTQQLMGRPPALSRAKLRRLREWQANRKTAKDMAAELGIGVSTLHSYLRGEHKAHRSETA